MRSIVALFFFQIISISLFSQEVLNDLFANPVLIKKEVSSSLKSTNLTVELPFFDDFSDISDLPSELLWQDKNVFINATYPIGPPSIGVATFDAIDANGYVYESMSNISSPADTLTSNLINLSGANQDSTWLSFYFQPQGYGNAPEYNDSLILQFISNGVVYPIWFYNGTDYASFKNDTLGIDDDRPDTLEFKLVHIKLDNPAFFTNSFQFQFVNYASIAGLSYPSARTNTDYWNIDYIYLNDDRFLGDTIFHDIAMVTPSTLFMTNYSSVPWSHYREALIQELSDIYFHVRNNDSKSRTMNEFTIYVEDLKTGALNDYYIGRKTLQPYYNNSNLLWNFIRSPIEWYEADSAQFRVSGEFDTGLADFAGNNYTSRIVDYKNYYSYDDGTAEKAYGVDSYGAKVAYKYTIHKADTLRSVQMYFSRNKDDYAAVQSFTLCIWADYNGEPGSVILKEEGKKPKFSGNINEFVSIAIDSALFLEGTFYIGWEQTDDLLMNVGYDANTNHPSKLFYNVNSQWYPSDFKGSLMMRPVFSQNKLNSSISDKKKNEQLSIAPNPSNGFITIIGEDDFLFGKIQIFNYLGKIVYEKSMNSYETIDINHLNSGMFIVIYYPEKGDPKSTRLIITK